MGRQGRWLFFTAVAALALAPAASGDRILFVTDRETTEVWVMNEDGSGQTAVTSRDPWVYAPAWSPDGSRIAFGGTSVSRAHLWLRVLDGSVLQSLGVPASPESDWSWYDPDWSPDARRIAFSYRTDINVVRRDGQGRKRITRGGNSFSPAWSPDRRWIAFERSGFVHRIRANGTGHQRLGRGRSPDWSPSGDRIVFVWETGFQTDMYSMRADGTDRRRLTTTPQSEGRPAWSPNGGLIAFDRGSSIWVMRPDGTRLRRLVTTAGAPTWAPTGRRLAFGRNGALYTVGVSGSGLRRLLTPEWDVDVAASPDGSRIAYTSQRPFGQSGVYVADADGSDEVFLHAGGAPDWSPDGTRILLQDEGGPVVIDADGSDPTELPVPMLHENGTNWSWHPDGIRVSFSDPVNCGDVYTMNLDGTGVTRLTPDTCLPTALSYDWLPSGAGIVFAGRPCLGCPRAIFALALPGGIPVALTDPPVGSLEVDPQVSPDGARIVFVRAVNFFGDETVRVMDVDGSDEQLLSNQADSRPTWLPESP